MRYVVIAAITILIALISFCLGVDAGLRRFRTDGSVHVFDAEGDGKELYMQIDSPEIFAENSRSFIVLKVVPHEGKSS